jgi:hypothetical protein
MARGEMERMEAAEVAEVLRYLVRRELRQGATIATVARDIGVPRSTLSGFLQGRGMRFRLFDALRELWRDRAPAVPHRGMIALGILADALPSAIRQNARAAVALELTQLLEAHDVPVPHWLMEERAPLDVWTTDDGGS